MVSEFQSFFGFGFCFVPFFLFFFLVWSRAGDIHKSSSIVHKTVIDLECFSVSFQHLVVASGKYNMQNLPKFKEFKEEFKDMSVT